MRAMMWDAFNLGPSFQSIIFLNHNLQPKIPHHYAIAGRFLHQPAVDIRN